MTEQIVRKNQEDEISLLDILVTLAESWKLLVFGPLVVGLLSAGLSFLWPPTYESVAIVRLTEEEIALLHAAPVLDPLIEKFGFLQEANGNKDDARVELKKHLSYSTDKKTKLATVVSKGRTPESAQALGQAAMDALLIELQPKGKEKEAILQEIEINNQLIADGVYLVERQGSKQNNASNSGNLNSGNNISNGNSLGNANASNSKGQIANLKINNLELSLRLQARGKEVFAQEPSLSHCKVAPKRSLVALLSTLTTSFVLVIFVFAQKNFIKAIQNEQTAAKIKLIKHILIKK